MAKANISFGATPTDHVVKAWLEERGIDPKYVSGYRITRGTGDWPLIELTMFYDERPVEEKD